MENVSLGKKCPKKLSCDMYRIKKNYSSHHAANDLSRTVIFLEGNLCSTLCSTLCGPIKAGCVHLLGFCFQGEVLIDFTYYVTTAILLTFHIRVAHTLVRANYCTVHVLLTFAGIYM